MQNPETPTKDDLEADVLPEGATLVLDSESVDSPEAMGPSVPQRRITRESFLGILRKLLATEQISPRQAREMRHKFGISNKSFGKKKVDLAKKKRKRKIAKASRRANRYNGSIKGQYRASQPVRVST